MARTSTGRGTIAWQRWLIVVLIAAAAAWMEATTVVYWRSVLGRLQPYQPNPLPNGAFAGTEALREAAWLVMVAAVGLLAGRSWRSRLGYALVVFGTLQILYYLSLSILIGWPRSPLDWDLLFLIPLPWWGPVVAPSLIAALMVVGGTLVTRVGENGLEWWPGRVAVMLCGVGTLLALYAFMQDALRAFLQGAPSTRDVLPTRFSWEMFVPAVCLMAAPVADVGWRALRSGAAGNRRG